MWVDRRLEIIPLTSFRFIAAFLVFLFHIHIRWPMISNVFFNNILMEGAVGMSLFFILSGFILTYNYYGSDLTLQKNYISFLVKRFARIYPVYVLSGLLFMILGFFNIEAPYKIAKAIYILSIDTFLLQGWFPTLFKYWNNGGTWSLSVEAFCYILFPTILVYLSNQSKNKLFLLLLITYVFTVIPGLSAMCGDAIIMYSIPIYRLPEFIMGMMAGIIFVKFPKRQGYIEFKLACISIAACIWLGYFGINLSNYVGHNVFIVPAFTFTIFLIANLKEGFLFKLFANKIFRFLGEISYSFFLLQGITITLAERYHAKMIAYYPFLANNRILCILIFLSTLLLSILSFIFVEQPSRRTILMIYKQRQLQGQVFATAGSYSP